MATASKVKPTHKAVKSYYAALATYADQSARHEGALRSAFQNLLAETGRKVGWTLIPELSLDANGHQIRPDGTFRDEFTIERGYWEAKDTDDDLAAEIKKKIKRGYRLTNTIFEDTREGRLYQGGKLEMTADLSQPQQLCDLLNAFFSHTEPAHEDFNKAVDEFKQRVPDLARGLVDLIKRAHGDNPRFAAAFGKFHELCQQSLNPNLSTAAVDEMLVQHLLTERLIRTVFDSQDFTRRNVIAAEIEKVIDALVSQSFNRHDYLKRLDRFYVAIEQAARTLSGFAEKQHFLNIVYERFFQGYSVKVADTHGIVYTPQEIVDFMCASVAEVLEKEFGKKLGDPEVNILDPCTGTGNFIVNLIRRIPKRDLPRMYRRQLFANEVMLLPYYIAALNIEHAYYERTGRYEPFEGLCFVDTLDLAEGAQKSFGFMAEENVQRVERQRKAPITVIIGNPPYNAAQINENDNNKNRKYEVVDKRIRVTYAKDSSVTLKNKLYDAYVKFFRWATDRLGRNDGILCFVSNNNFVEQPTFDGMRKHLLSDFTTLRHVDMHGNVRRNPKLSGTTHNVFGIQVGVGITLAVRNRNRQKQPLKYHRVPENWRREEKLSWLAHCRLASRVPWTDLTPEGIHPVTGDARESSYEAWPILGTKASKASKGLPPSGVLFTTYTPGVLTGRDRIVHDFIQARLLQRIRAFCDNYNAEVDRFIRSGADTSVDDFVRTERVKWSYMLKEKLRRRHCASFEKSRCQNTLYRPFSTLLLYYDPILVDARGLQPYMFPGRNSEDKNQVICVPGLGNRKGFGCLLSRLVASYDLAFEKTQVFPFYMYDKDGTNRRENVTDWALKLFREHYGDDGIGKWDIFYYVYGVLHHPGYREKFADNLKRELPRIPLAPALADQYPERERRAGDTDQYPERKRRAGDTDPNPERERRAGGVCDPRGPVADARGTAQGADAGQYPERERGAGGGAAGAARRCRSGFGSADETSAGTHGSHRPTAGGFWAFADAGRRLAKLHIEYESLEPWPLEWLETPGEPLSYVVEKMRLAKDKKSIEVNDSLTLGGIPPVVFEYRLGNRSALEWVIDQYRVKEDKRSGIRSDPNNPDDPEYIVRLVGQVVRVSVETVKIVAALPQRYAPEPEAPPSAG